MLAETLKSMIANPPPLVPVARPTQTSAVDVAYKDLASALQTKVASRRFSDRGDTFRLEARAPVKYSTLDDRGLLDAMNLGITQRLEADGFKVISVKCGTYTSWDAQFPCVMVVVEILK